MVSIAFTGQALIRDEVSSCKHPRFIEVEDIIKKADHAFTNLEGTIRGRHGGYPMVGTGYFPECGPDALDCLRKMGFDILSLSNNHSWDLGAAGILSTIEEVQKRGFLSAGIGADLAAARRPGFCDTPQGRIALIALDAGPQPDYVYATEGMPGLPARPGINQLKVHPRLRLTKTDLDFFRELSARIGHEKFKQAHARYGFRMIAPDGITYYEPKDAFSFYNLALDPGNTAEPYEFIDPENLETHLDIVRAARKEADHVIVYLHSHHWPAEFSRVPEWIIDFAHKTIDNGASAFVGHGMPQLHGIEIYKKRPIFYSLGNFIFHLEPPRAVFNAPEVWQSVVVTATLDASKGVSEIVLEPIVLCDENGEQPPQIKRRYPMRAHGQLASDILGRVATLSGHFGTKVEPAGTDRARVVI